MTMSRSSATTEKLLRAWLERLADLTRQGSDPVDAESLDNVVQMLLIDGLPDGAYTARSLQHVAKSHKFFPSYNEIRDGLMGWWDANLPHLAPRLARPKTPSLSPMDESWLGYYHRRVAEIEAPGYIPHHGSVAADLANLASLLRQESRPAFNVAFNVSWPVPLNRAVE